ncbi:MAG: hypothetical protein AB9903_00560 [Vulcanimicrobiota bacterium]
MSFLLVIMALFLVSLVLIISGLISNIMDGRKVLTYIAILALSDRGTPAYDENLAGKLAGIRIPAFACTPSLLPEFIEGALKGCDLNALANRFRHHRRPR